MMDEVLKFDRIESVLSKCRKTPHRQNIFSKMSSTSHNAPDSTDRSVDLQKAEPLLYDELVRRQQSLLADLEKQKIVDWDDFEKRFYVMNSG
jgi:hypothetical protein